MPETARPDVPAAWQRVPLVAIVRGSSPDHVGAVCDAIMAGGIECIEVTLNTPGALDVLAARSAGPGLWGAGTVLTADQVDEVADAGGTFCVTPVVDEAVGAACRRRGLAWYPGAATPTEIHHAWTLGAAAVKVFPAASLGGPQYLREVLAPLDEIRLVPTGGVDAASAAEYLAAGAVAVGLGGSLIGDALRSGDLAGLSARVSAAVLAVRR